MELETEGGHSQPGGEPPGGGETAPSPTFLSWLEVEGGSDAQANDPQWSSYWSPDSRPGGFEPVLGAALVMDGVHFAATHFAEFRSVWVRYAMGAAMQTAAAGLFFVVMSRWVDWDAADVAQVFVVMWLVFDQVFYTLVGAASRGDITRKVMKKISGAPIGRGVGALGGETRSWWQGLRCTAREFRILWHSGIGTRGYWHRFVSRRLTPSFWFRASAKLALRLFPLFLALLGGGNKMLRLLAAVMLFAVLSGWLHSWKMVGGLMLDLDMSLEDQLRHVRANFFLFESYGVACRLLLCTPLAPAFEVATACGAAFLLEASMRPKAEHEQQPANQTPSRYADRSYPERFRPVAAMAGDGAADRYRNVRFVYYMVVPLMLALSFIFVGSTIHQVASELAVLVGVATPLAALRAHWRYAEAAGPGGGAPMFWEPAQPAADAPEPMPLRALAVPEERAEG